MGLTRSILALGLGLAILLSAQAALAQQEDGGLSRAGETGREDEFAADKGGDEFEDEFSEYFEDDEQAMAPTIADPLEGFNRAMFWFNDYLYFYAAKPLARAWGAVVPQPLRRGISNAFYNLAFPIRFVSSLLQGKPGRAAQETGRFLLNSTFGLGGLVNVAKGVDLDPPEEDLGQTFGVWGLGHGFYLYLPFIGPSSGRDFTGSVGDRFLDPLTWLFWDFSNEDMQLKEWSDEQRLWVPMAIAAGEGVNDLSFRIGDYEALKRASLDPYAAIRDIYAQARLNQVKE